MNMSRARSLDTVKSGSMRRKSATASRAARRAQGWRDWPQAVASPRHRNDQPRCERLMSPQPVRRGRQGNCVAFIWASPRRIAQRYPDLTFPLIPQLLLDHTERSSRTVPSPVAAAIRIRRISGPAVHRSAAQLRRPASGGGSPVRSLLFPRPRSRLCWTSTIHFLEHSMNFA
jgi:hypothetical protein